MKTITIVRDSHFTGKAMLGKCTVYSNNKKILFRGDSLERGWMDNKSNVSCIPDGEYKVVLEFSPRFKKDLWEIKGVPGRSECKFHAANYWNQLNGCIALGTSRGDINSDGITDVQNSKVAMGLFHEALKGEKEVTLCIITSL